MKRSFFIAGVQFRPIAEIGRAMKEITIGDILPLSPEPTNKYDPNAVQILFEHADGPVDVTFLGYVPKKFSAEVAGLMEAGVDLECVVEVVNPAAKPWEMCKVVVKEVEE